MFMSARPEKHGDDYDMIHLGGETAVVVPLHEYRPPCRLASVGGMSAAGHSLSGDHIQLGRKVADSMIGGMTRQKIAITLPEEQVAAARQAVAEGRAASVSAFISRALARRDADEELAETIAEIYRESGQPTEEDRLWARRVLGLEP
jgi:Arc/MetJ-type ribon-helix-helix transcriptional regulator